MRAEAERARLVVESWGDFTESSTGTKLADDGHLNDSRGGKLIEDIDDGKS